MGAFVFLALLSPSPVGSRPFPNRFRKRPGPTSYLSPPLTAPILIRRAACAPRAAIMRDHAGAPVLVRFDRLSSNLIGVQIFRNPVVVNFWGLAQLRPGQASVLSPFTILAKQLAPVHKHARKTHCNRCSRQ